MIPGTGPGRGTPWWRWRRIITLARYWAETESEGAEVPGQPREGRTVAVVPRQEAS